MSRLQRDATHAVAARKNRHIGRIAALCALALVLTGISTAGFGYAKLQGNVKQHDISSLLSDRPTIPADSSAGNAQNILLIGSDVRSGASDIDGSGAAGDVVGMRGDVTMLLHISADRSRVDVVSIPRDLIVPIPACKVLDSNNQVVRTSQARTTKFNTAFAIGGADGNVGSAAACTMSTVEQLTGVRLTGFMVANFAAFQNIVDAIGGVPMYFETALKDSYSGLNVEQGCVLLNGTDALALARARKQIGDGSDTGRIRRQQALVTAIVNEAMQLNLFTDMGKLYKVLASVTANLETSEGLGNITTLAGLIGSLQNLGLSDITFITAPYDATTTTITPADGSNQIWDAVAKDEVIPVTVNAAGQIEKKATASPSASSPSDTSSSSDAASSGSDTSGASSSDAASPSAASTTSSASSSNSSASASASATASSSAATCTKENAK